MGKLWVVEGKVGGSGPLVVEGWIEGTVRVPGRFELLPGARGSGTVEAEVARIEGRFTGRIVASERIELVAGCVVDADLAAPRIVVEEGAVFHGKVQMGSDAGGSREEIAPASPQRGLTGAPRDAGTEARGEPAASMGAHADPNRETVPEGRETAEDASVEDEAEAMEAAAPAKGRAEAVELLAAKIARESLPVEGRSGAAEGAGTRGTGWRSGDDAERNRIAQDEKPAARREPPLPPASAFSFGAMNRLPRE